MIAVGPENFYAVLDTLSEETHLAFDTETTGLRPYHDDRLFCLVIASATQDYYFNFHPDHPHVLTKEHLIELGRCVFAAHPRRVLAAHNAKFDLAMLSREGVTVGAKVVDTKIYSRLLANEKLKHDLASCALEVGYEKDSGVEEYIQEHHLWEWVEVPGKDKRDKKKYYNKVPYEIISTYAAKDARITFELFQYQLKKILSLDLTKHDTWPSFSKVVCNENALLKTVFSMEQVGVKIDDGYCRDATTFLADKMVALAAEFEVQTGVPFKNSSTVFKQVFNSESLTYGDVTPTGKVNAKFDTDALKKFAHPAAKTVLLWRDAKKTSEYFHAFLYHADKNGVIHPSFNQDGTATGRFSSSSPNFQNLTKDDDTATTDTFLVRRAIVPREGYFFAMFDYDQMEYKLMLDYAGASGLIAKVLGGMDVHQATADIAGISRSAAKTTNFSVLYGAGITLLAERLEVSTTHAKKIKQAIFSAAPEIERFIENVQSAASRRGFIFNWMGRRYQFPDKRFIYKAPNYLIQGGCADIVKVAMNRVAEFLAPLKSRMVLTVHDEIVVECHLSEVSILPEIKSIMEGVYTPRNSLPMTCGVEYSFTNLADKLEGYPEWHKSPKQSLEMAPSYPF